MSVRFSVEPEWRSFLVEYGPPIRRPILACSDVSDELQPELRAPNCKLVRELRGTGRSGADDVCSGGRAGQGKRGFAPVLGNVLPVALVESRFRSGQAVPNCSRMKARNFD